MRKQKLPVPIFQRATAKPKSEHKEIAELTRREREILACVANGLRNREIAEKLCISEQTVKTHLTRIFAKLDVNSRLGAALAFYGKDRPADGESAAEGEAAEPVPPPARADSLVS